jgi:hypothetical protein
MVKAMFAAVVCGAVSYFVRTYIEKYMPIPASENFVDVAKSGIPIMAGSSICGLAVYLGFLKVLCPAEFSGAILFIKQKLANRRKNKS